MDTHAREATLVMNVLASLVNWGLFWKEEFCSFESKIFLFAVDAFAEDAWCSGKQAGSQNNGLPCKCDRKINQSIQMNVFRFYQKIWSGLIPTVFSVSLTRESLLPLSHCCRGTLKRVHRQTVQTQIRRHMRHLIRVSTVC